MLITWRRHSPFINWSESFSSTGFLITRHAFALGVFLKFFLDNVVVCKALCLCPKDGVGMRLHLSMTINQILISNGVTG